MEKYLIYVIKTNTQNKEYLSYIYRNSISKNEDIGDAIEFETKEQALVIKDYLNKREEKSVYRVMCIKTTIEEEVK